MSHITIQGGRRLEGALTVQGAKNSVLPILAATKVNGTGPQLAAARVGHLRPAQPRQNGAQEERFTQPS